MEFYRLLIMIMQIVTFDDFFFYRDNGGTTHGVPPGAPPALLRPHVFTLGFIQAEVELSKADHDVAPTRGYEFSLGYDKQIHIIM